VQPARLREPRSGWGKARVPQWEAQIRLIGPISNAGVVYGGVPVDPRPHLGDMNNSVVPPSDIFHRFIAEERRSSNIRVAGIRARKYPSGEGCEIETDPTAPNGSTPAFNFVEGADWPVSQLGNEVSPLGKVVSSPRAHRVRFPQRGKDAS
jgi:hypothetical protein